MPPLKIVEEPADSLMNTLNNSCSTKELKNTIQCMWKTVTSEKDQLHEKMFIDEEKDEGEVQLYHVETLEEMETNLIEMGTVQSLKSLGDTDKLKSMENTGKLLENTGNIMNNLKELNRVEGIGQDRLLSIDNKQSLKTSLMDSHKNNTFDVSGVSSIKVVSNMNDSPSTEAA